MIRLEHVYKYQSDGKHKFEKFRAIINGTVFDPIPIGFLRISELDNLLKMLQSVNKDKGEVLKVVIKKDKNTEE